LLPILNPEYCCHYDWHLRHFAPGAGAVTRFPRHLISQVNTHLFNKVTDSQI
jgi:hypothetical protein